MIIEIILISFLMGISTGISTITGFGTSTISIPILLNFFPLHQTLLFVGIIHWIGTIWKMILFKKGFSSKMLLLFGLPALIGSYLGARSTFTLPTTIISPLLGSFLIFYVFIVFFVPTFKIKKTPPSIITGGGISGFVVGIFGLGGALRSVFLMAYKLPIHVYLFTTNLIAFLIDIVRLTTYFSGGMRLTPGLWLSLAVSLPVSLLCAWIARHVVTTIPEQHFRSIVGVFLGLTGLKLLFFP